jgi:leucyl-tRNA synthetase
MAEPFRGLFTQGMVTHETYRAGDGSWLSPDEVRREGDDWIHIESGRPATLGRIEKMSKSKRNTVDPEPILAKYGADAVRWFMLSDSPPERDLEWSEAGIEGASRFVQRVWKLVTTNGKSKPCLPRSRAVETLVQLIAPMAPHLAEECWEELHGEEGLIVDTQWPKFDPALLVDDQVTLAVQVNGKLRDTLSAPRGLDRAAAEELALASEKVQRQLAGAVPRKVIVVPDRLVNIVA